MQTSLRDQSIVQLEGFPGFCTNKFTARRLQPFCVLQYSDQDYWNDRYIKSDGNAFEWYQRYDSLRYIINPLIPKNVAILQVSTLRAPVHGTPIARSDAAAVTVAIVTDWSRKFQAADRHGT